MVAERRPWKVWLVEADPFMDHNMHNVGGPTPIAYHCLALMSVTQVEKYIGRLRRGSLSLGLCLLVCEGVNLGSLLHCGLLLQLRRKRAKRAGSHGEAAKSSWSKSEGKRLNTGGACATHV